MSNKVLFHLFGKPAIILIADIIMAISFGHALPNTHIIEVNADLKGLILIVALLATAASGIWLLLSSYSYISHYAGYREPCKHCGDVVSIVSNSCLNCQKHQWY